MESHEIMASIFSPTRIIEAIAVAFNTFCDICLNSLSFAKAPKFAIILDYIF